MPASMPNHWHGQNQSQKVGCQAKTYQDDNTKGPQQHCCWVVGAGAQAGDGGGPCAGVAVQHEGHGDDADAENEGGKHGASRKIDEQKCRLFKREYVDDYVGKGWQCTAEIMRKDAHGQACPGQKHEHQ